MPSLSEIKKKPELWKRYQSETHEAFSQRLRAALGAGLILFIALHAFDVRFFPDLAQPFLVIRLVVCTILLIDFFFTFWHSFGAFWMHLFALGIFALGLGFMLDMTQGVASRFGAGFHILLLSLPLVNAFYVGWNIAAGILIFGVFMFNLHFYHPALQDAWTVSTHLGITFLWMVLGSVMVTRYYRQGFISRETLQDRERLLGETQQRLDRVYQDSEETARLDDLSRIANRRLLMESIAYRMKAAERNQAFFYLVLVDVDQFKKINHETGHAVGDQVLHSVGEMIRNSLRKNNFLARYGGDEFIFIFGNAPKEQVEARMKDILRRLETIELNTSAGVQKVKASIGAVKMDPLVHYSEEVFLRAAEVALMQAKHAEQSKIVIQDSASR